MSNTSYQSDSVPEVGDLRLTHVGERPWVPPWRVVLSHTSELGEVPPDRTFVEAAKDAVARAGHAIFDMAFIGARDDHPAHCSKRMVEMADVYVGIIGLLYGSIVPDGTGRSYTEFEFDTATAAGLPRLIFLIRNGGPFIATRRQPSANKAKQQAFRQRLQNECGVTVAWVKSPSDLEIGLYQALRDLRSDR